MELLYPRACVVDDDGSSFAPAARQGTGCLPSRAGIAVLPRALTIVTPPPLARGVLGSRLGAMFRDRVARAVIYCSLRVFWVWTHPYVVYKKYLEVK